ncbi:uncharacterized protein LOC134213377 isoform X2 [Armigeres subalbatus]
MEYNAGLDKVKVRIHQEMETNVDKSTVESVHELWNIFEQETWFLKANIPSIESSVSLVTNGSENSLHDLIEKIKMILADVKCSSIEGLLENYQELPHCIIIKLRAMLIRYLEELNKVSQFEDELDFLKCGHQMFYGTRFLDFLTTDYPSYEVFIKNSNLHIVMGALLFTDIYKKRGFVETNGLKDISRDGPNWVETQRKLKSSFLNTDDNQILECIKQGAYPDVYLFESLNADSSATLRNIITKQLYLKLKTFSKYIISEPIMVDLVHRMLTDDFKIKAALSLKRYDQAFSLSNKQICDINETFFCWESFIYALGQSEAGSQLWQPKTFCHVTRKLIDVANVQSLTYYFTFLNKLLPSSHGELCAMLRIIKSSIRTSFIDAENADRLENMISSFIFEQCRLSFGTCKEYDYLELLKSISSMRTEIDIDQKDIWMAPSFCYKIIDCQTLSEQQRILLLKFCHALGNKFWIQPPQPVLPVMTYALSKGCNELLSFLMDVSCQEFEDLHSRFMMIIQQSSVDIFKLFLSYHKFNDEHTFNYISNALQEMYIKQIYISSELRTFLLHKLAQYGFNVLCSISTVSKNPMDWIGSIQSIVRYVDHLKYRSDRGDFLGVDNEVLFYLRMVHNQLFFIKDKPIIFIKKNHKNEPYFERIPLKEMTTLLAIFLSSFNLHETMTPGSESYTVYRMVLNKLTLMKYLEFIAGQLQHFLSLFFNLVERLSNMIKDSGSSPKRKQIQFDWSRICRNDNSLPKLSDNIWNRIFSKKFSSLLTKNAETVVQSVLLSEPIEFDSTKRSKTSKQISKLYYRVKQLYSLNKIFQILQHISSYDDCKERTVAALKRFNQIFGESIKNTKNSQNLPSKLNRTLNYQLRDYILIVKKTRDVTCHDYPLVKKFLTLEEQYTFYARIEQKQVRMLTVTVAMLLICTYSEYWRCLFGSLYRCRSLHNFKSLIKFVGNQDIIESYQVQCLDVICKYHDDIQESLDAIMVDLFSSRELQSFERIKKNHGRRLGTIEKLREKIKDSFGFRFRDIQIAAFSTGNVRHLLCINLLPKDDYNIREYIENTWVVLDEDHKILSKKIELLEHNVNELKSTLFNLEINRESMQEYHSHQEVREIVSRLHKMLVDKNCHDKHILENALNKKLDQKKYFNNIFLIKHKIKAIRDVFENTTSKQLDDEINEIEKKEISELENIFRSIQQSIRNVYTQYNCSTIELLMENIAQIPQKAVLAIEYCLLELCEILTSTNQFQDNFHTIKYDLQMICGRNFRNYLAHDSLSYDILTCSSRVKVLINGLVMAWKESWKLFEIPKSNSLTGINDPKTMGPKWLKEQLLDFDSIANFRATDAIDLIGNSVLTSGRFWIPNGVFEGLLPLQLTEMVHCVKSDDLRKYVDPFYSNSESMFSRAIHNGDFEMAAIELNGQSWCQRICPQNYPCFGGLLKYLHQQENIREILSVLEILNTGYFLFSDSQGFIGYLKNHKPADLHDAQIHSIYLRSPLDYLLDLIPDDSATVDHLIAAILVNHFEYFEHLLKLPRILKHLVGSKFETCAKLCARFGRIEMLLDIITLPPCSQAILDLTLSVATRHRHWKLVSLLQTEHRANPWNYMNEFYAGDLAIRMGNLSIFKMFLKILSNTEYNFQSLLSTVAEFGLVPMAQFLIKMGCDVWQNEKILLLANANKKDAMMLDVVEDLLFKFKKADDKDAKLHEWKRVVHEWELLNNFNESSRLFLNNYQRSEKMLNKMLTFGKMDDGCSVTKIESSVIKCDDPRINIFRSVRNLASFDINIKSMTPTGPPLSVQIDYQMESEGMISDIVLDVFNAKTDFPSSFTLSKSYTSKPFPIFVCYDLIKLVDSCTSSSAIIGQFQLETQQIRFIRVGSSLYIVHIGKMGSPTYLEGFFNATNRRGQTIFNSLHSDVDIELIKILLSTGIDLTAVDKFGKNSLMLTLDALCSWEVLEFLLEHCFKNNIRSVQNIHIFQMQDHEGCTLLQYAILVRRLNVVTFLLNHGVDQTTPDHLGRFPIHYAVLSGSLLIADILIDRKENVVNVLQILSKHSPLMMAVNMNNIQMVKLLLRKGADINLRSDKGETAVEWAISMERYNILVEILHHAGSLEIDVVSNIAGDRENALQRSLLQDNLDIFKLILEHMVCGPIGASRESLIAMKHILLAKDYDGMNIFDYAFLLLNNRIFLYLKECENLYEKVMGEPLRQSDCSWISMLSRLDSTSGSTSEQALKEIDDLD